MKKLLALLMALCMLFSLVTLFAGCEDSGKKKRSSSDYDDEDEENEDEDEEDNKDDEDKEDEENDEDEKDDPTGDDLTDPDESEPEVTEPTETEPPVTEPLVTEPEPIVPVLGKINGLVYENEYLGIGCELPEGWGFYSDEELEATFGVTVDHNDPEAMSQMKMLYDIMAVSSDGNLNVNICMEKNSQTALALLDMESKTESMAQLLKTGMENQGYTVISSEASHAEIDGEEYCCVNLEMSVYGISMYQTQLYMICGEYFVGITATSVYENRIADIYEMFYFLMV